MNIRSTTSGLFLMLLFLPHCQLVSGAIVIELEDTSSGLTMSMSGTLNTVGLTLDGPEPTDPSISNFIDDGTLTLSFIPLIQANGNGTSYATFTSSQVPLSSLIISPASSPASFSSGDYFAYADLGTTGVFAFQTPAGFVPGDTISIQPTVTFGPGTTIASIFGSNLNSTAQVLSVFSNGETLSIRAVSAVPEPGSAIVFATFIVAGIVRRHRTSQKRQDLIL